MRYVFMGTPDFAVASLRKLVDAGYPPVAVVTAPDKPAGRGQKMSVPAVKEFALSTGIQVLQPVRLKDPAFLDTLRSLNPLLQVVVAFRMLPEQVWNMPPLGTYNLHASLLPQYRGAAPINWAIINGEIETGVTTFRLRHEIDSGDLLFQERVPIPPEADAGEMHDILKNIGADLLLKTVKEIERSLLAGTPLPFVRQDESKVSHAPKLSRETGRINWAMPASRIHDLVRGLSPNPGAFTTICADGENPQVLKIYRSETRGNNALGQGEVRADGRGTVQVGCGVGSLQLLDVQLEGRKRMSAAEFLKGFRISPGTIVC